MSAIAASVSHRRAVIAADGICYENATGNVVGFVGKLDIYAHLGCVIGFVGMGDMGAGLRTFIDRLAVSSFDDLVPHLVECVQQSWWGLRQHFGISLDDAKATVIVIGWSEREQRFQFYKIHTWGKTITNAATNETSDVEQWHLIPLDSGFWASSMPVDGALEKVGALDEGQSDVDVVALMICALRLSSSTTGPHDGNPYALQMGLPGQPPIRCSPATGAARITMLHAASVGGAG